MPRRSRLTDTVRETLHFFRQGKTVSEIARLRGVKDGTIYSHLEEAMLAGEAIDVKSLLTAEAQRDIAAAFARHGFGSLGSVVASLGGRYDYGQCRIVRAAMQAKIGRGELIRAPDVIAMRSETRTARGNSPLPTSEFQIQLAFCGREP